MHSPSVEILRGSVPADMLDHLEWFAYEYDDFLSANVDTSIGAGTGACALRGEWEDLFSSSGESWEPTGAPTYPLPAFMLKL